MQKDLENKLNDLKKDYFVLDETTAPQCYEVYTKFDSRLLIDVLTRIQNKKNIYENYGVILSDKIRIVILPALLNDKIVEECEGGYRARCGKFIFSEPNRRVALKRASGCLEEAVEYIPKDKLENARMFYFNRKNIPKAQYEEIVNETINLAKKISMLQSVDGQDTVDCEFGFFNYFE